jgi:serine/threonine protein kinase
MPSSLRRPRSIGTDFRTVGKRIGAGNFGDVYLGEHVATGQRVAVKVEKEAAPKGLRFVIGGQCYDLVNNSGEVFE